MDGGYRSIDRNQKKTDTANSIKSSLSSSINQYRPKFNDNRGREGEGKGESEQENWKEGETLRERGQRRIHVK